MLSTTHWQPRLDDLYFMNVGAGMDLSIRDLAEAVANATGGTIKWDTSKPESIPKKQLDVIRLAKSGLASTNPMAESLASTVELFRERLSPELAWL